MKLYKELTDAAAEKITLSEEDKEAVREILREAVRDITEKK